MLQHISVSGRFYRWSRLARLLPELQGAERSGLFGRRGGRPPVTRFDPRLMLRDGGLPLLGAGRALARPALDRSLAGGLRVLLSAFGIGVEALDAGVFGFAESRILIPAECVLTYGIAMPILTRIRAARNEINALGLGDAPGASLPDAEGNADAFGVSLVA